MKVFFCVLLCILVALCGGCGETNLSSVVQNNSSEVSSKENSKPVNENSSSVSSEGVKLPEKYAIIHDGEKLNVDKNCNQIKALYKGNLVYATSKEVSEQASDLNFYLCSIASKKAERIGKVPSWNTDSNDFVVMKDSLYYCPLLFGNKAMNSLVKLDFNKKKVLLEADYDLDPSLVYFEKMNDKEFLFTDTNVLAPEKTKKKSKDTWETRIKKYNVDTKKETVLVKEQYDRENKNGTALVSADIKGNLIYSYNIKYDSDKVKSFIEVYDLKGALIKTIPLPELEKQLKEDTSHPDSVFSFKTFGDYFYFETLENLNYLFKNTEDGVKEVTFPIQLASLIENSERGLMNTKDNKSKIYFKMHYDNALGILDKDTLDFKMVQFNMDGFQFVNNLVMDESGNIVVELRNKSETDDPNVKRQFYYIKSEDLLNAK